MNRYIDFRQNRVKKTSLDAAWKHNLNWCPSIRSPLKNALGHGLSGCCFGMGIAIVFTIDSWFRFYSWELVESKTEQWILTFENRFRLILYIIRVCHTNFQTKAACKFEKQPKLCNSLIYYWVITLQEKRTELYRYC